MKEKLIANQFARMGARFKIVHQEEDRFRLRPADYAIDIRHDQRGEFFEMRVPSGLEERLEVTVMQARPQERHLLIFVRNGEATKDRFLCGHDEREWFVAAVPGVRPPWTKPGRPSSLRACVRRNNVSTSRAANVTGAGTGPSSDRVNGSSSRPTCRKRREQS